MISGFSSDQTPLFSPVLEFSFRGEGQEKINIMTVCGSCMASGQMLDASGNTSGIGVEMGESWGGDT